jgi:hypothetical protein
MLQSTIVASSFFFIQKGKKINGVFLDFVQALKLDIYFLEN